MTSFTLDTSGAVIMRRDLLSNGVPAEPDEIRWPDLSPFVQGYVEAVFQTWSTLRAEHRKRPPSKLSDGQIWLLKCGRRGFSRVTLVVPYSGHGSTATNYMCAGLIRRNWLEENRNGIVRITEAGERALRTAMPLGFSDLDPSALALILRDCEKFSKRDTHPQFNPNHKGKCLWIAQQAGALRDFPPLTPYLSNDGKVCLREAQP